MAKGQKKSNREAKKPKKSAEKPSAAAGTGMPIFSGKGFGTSYKDRYAKKTSK
jgi:hypothetical protein